MRESINIHGLGEIKLSEPRSLVSISDISAEWSGQTSNAKVSRLMAATLGLSWSRENSLKAPLYDVSTGEILGYGGVVLEFLIGKGVAPADLYRSCPSLIVDLLELLPSEKEVSKAEEFFQEEGESGQDDSQHREGVE